MFLPTHTIYLIKVDGSKENVSMCDCSTKKEVREEVKDLFKMWKTVKPEDYTKAQYVDKNEVVLYECTIKECMEEL